MREHAPVTRDAKYLYVYIKRERVPGDGGRGRRVDWQKQQTRRTHTHSFG